MAGSTPGNPLDSTPKNPTIPVGAVGVIASGQDQLAAAMLEMVEHFDHYRASAELHSHNWHAQHDAKRAVAHIIAAESPAAKAA